VGFQGAVGGIRPLVAIANAIFVNYFKSFAFRASKLRACRCLAWPYLKAKARYKIAPTVFLRVVFKLL